MDRARAGSRAAWRPSRRLWITPLALFLAAIGLVTICGRSVVEPDTPKSRSERSSVPVPATSVPLNPATRIAEAATPPGVPADLEIRVISRATGEPLASSLGWVDPLGRVRPDTELLSSPTGTFHIARWPDNATARITASGHFPEVVSKPRDADEHAAEAVVVRLSPIATGAIRGHTLDEAGGPIAYATVEIRSLGWSAQKWADFLREIGVGAAALICVTGPRGDFDFDAVPAGVPLQLVAHAKGFNQTSLPAPPIEPLQVREDVELRMTAGIPIECEVRSAQTGTPMDRVALTPRDTGPGSPKCIGAETDENGRATLLATQDGVYYVDVWAGQDYERQTVRVRTGAERFQITVAPRAVTRLEFDLNEDASACGRKNVRGVEGNVVMKIGHDVAQRPLARMRFVCQSLDGRSREETHNFRWLSFPTLGELIGDTVPPMTISAMLGTQELGSTVVRESGDVGKIQVNPTTLCAEGGVLLVISDTAGRPYRDPVTLRLEHQGTGSQLRCIPSDRGILHIAGFTPGTYSGRAEAMDSGWLSARFTVEIQAGAVVQLPPMRVEEPSSLVVTPTGGGDGLVSIRVWSRAIDEYVAVGTDGFLPTYERTGVVGHPITIEHLPSGPARVEARAAGGTLTVRDFVLTPGARCELGIALDPGAVLDVILASPKAEMFRRITVRDRYDESLVVYARDTFQAPGEALKLDVCLPKGAFLLTVEDSSFRWEQEIETPHATPVVVPSGTE